MAESPKRHTVTAALLYANGPVHIGHLGGCYLPADIYCRYLRSKGQEVLFISGSDEHGVAITIKARQEGRTPQQVIDHYHAMIEKSFQDLHISFDIYSRTSLPIHHETASAFFKKFYDEGKLEEKTTDQFYDPKEEIFLADRYIVGTCPVCGNERAYGDQCERCGSSLSPADLINPHSALSGETPVLRPTKHWFLPLDRYQGWIEAYIEQHNNWKPNVYGQCKAWLAAGLQPRSMTRDMAWGIPVPLPEAAGKVLYVWFDAPIGYISASKDWAQRKGEPEAWEKYWVKGRGGEESRLVHFIGKDNIVFHCIIFPTMLHEHGEFILADEVPANEFVNLEGEKISTSRNWAVWAHEYVEDFKEVTGGVDMLRYVLAATLPEAKDSDFSWKDFQTRVNSELVAVYSNFVHRVLTLVQKYYQGAVPRRGKLADFETDLFLNLRRSVMRMGEMLEGFKFREALTELMWNARVGNRYLADTEPWHLVETDPSRVQTILGNALQLCVYLAVMTEPFLPDTARRLWNLLGLAPMGWQQLIDWRGYRDSFFAQGHHLAPPTMLFQKVEDSLIEAQLAKLASKLQPAKPQGQAPAPATGTPSSAPATPTPLAASKQVLEAPKPTIPYEIFAQLDLRLGTITAAIHVPKADKLYQLTVDLGEERPRTILSGIAEHFTLEALVGQRVLVVANLAPRTLRGIESQGMILMAADGAGKLCFVQPAEEFGDGATVK